MARAVRRRNKQRIYWVEIGFLVLGLIALRPSLVTDLVQMGRGPVPYAPSSQFLGDFSHEYPRNDSAAAGVSSYYPVWNQPVYQTNDPRAFHSASSNVAWPDAQVHQWVHNGASVPLVASPSPSSNPWNSNYWGSNTMVPNPGTNRYPSSAPVYTGRY